MNKSQSFDGIIGPHHASSQRSASAALKAEAAQSVRRVYKRIIAKELDDMNEVDPEIVDAENNHGQGYDDEDFWFEDLAEVKNRGDYVSAGIDFRLH